MTFPPFVMWNGNLIDELALFGGLSKAGLAGFGWLVTITSTCVITLLPCKAADYVSGALN